MSFVMSETENNPENLFDPEQINYIFNRSSGINDAVIARKNIPMILAKLEEADKDILELLNYCRSDYDRIGDETSWIETSPLKYSYD